MATNASAHIRPDLQRRAELVPMDEACDDIAVALYVLADGTTGVVHSYASQTGVSERLDWLASAMRRLAGMDGEGRNVTFACGSWHENAARRTFLEAAKLDPTEPSRPKPLSLHDPRTDHQVTVSSLGGGSYRISMVAGDPDKAGRTPAVATGLIKLGDMQEDDSDAEVVRFACGEPHDLLVALLLPRAINVRAALREQEAAAARGVLVAPSAQQKPGT